MRNSNNSRGRTFWDLIAEHPKILVLIIAILILFVFFLAMNNYSIKLPMVSIEPNKSLPISNNSIVDSTKIRNVNTVDTSSYFRKNSIADPKIRIGNKHLIKNQPKKSDLKTEVVNVTSNGQSGGITANQVNIGAVPRVLSTMDQTDLLLFLKDKTERINITAIMGDPESFQFAQQINDFLKYKGYKQIHGVDQAVYTKPVIGQFINRDSIGVKILIGSKPNP